jgi:hypothetical protein
VKASLVLTLVLLASATAAASAATISGSVIDAATGRPVAGVPVAATGYSGDFSSPIAGDTLPEPAPGSLAVTAADGSYTLDAPGDGGPIALVIYGASHGFVTYHGVFAPGVTLVPRVQLIKPTAAEQHALNEINAFRRAPGGRAQYGASQPLVFDENLVLAARFWAREEGRAHRIGHTCAQLGEPSGCIEFNAYFHSLTGAPQDDDAGQNTAFDTDAGWSEANRLFEIEGSLCGYNWHACSGGADGSAAQTGHYVNLMSARRWAGFGETTADDGSYFTVNLL